MLESGISDFCKMAISQLLVNAFEWNKVHFVADIAFNNIMTPVTWTRIIFQFIPPGYKNQIVCFLLTASKANIFRLTFTQIFTSQGLKVRCGVFPCFVIYLFAISPDEGWFIHLKRWSISCYLYIYCYAVHNNLYCLSQCTLIISGSYLGLLGNVFHLLFTHGVYDKTLTAL